MGFAKCFTRYALNVEAAIQSRHWLAFRCCMGNERDPLVAGKCVLQKEEQDPALKADYSLAFEAD